MNLFDDGAPQCHITTIADMAAIPLPPSQAPEFAFSPRVERRDPEPRPKVTHPQAPAEPFVWVREYAVGPRAHNAPGKADPIWDTAFRTKFRYRNPVADTLPTPKGAAKVIADFLDRAAEIAYLARTQHEELATTRDQFRAAGIEATSLEASVEHEAANLADIHLNRTPYGVQLPDGSVADMVYVANMARRIEWERATAACGKPLRAEFAASKTGDLDINAYGPGTHEQVLSVRKAVKNRWLDAHGELPDAKGIVELRKSLKGSRLIERDETAARAYEVSRAYGDEDPDPWRIEHHADPDPEPQRWQYPYGDCWHCWLVPGEENHRNCEVLGTAMFVEDKERWDARQTDIGYAGPKGFIRHDDEHLDLLAQAEEGERVSSAEEPGPE